jgi:uncharacterized damage-inducible protein DinB
MLMPPMMARSWQERESKTVQSLKDAISYHIWAVNTNFGSCEGLDSEAFTRDLGNSFASVRDTLVHCLMADGAWYHRVRQLPFEKPNPADYPDLASLRAVWPPLLADWQTLIAQPAALTTGLLMARHTTAALKILYGMW